jgi:hypothetical protein
MSVPMIDVKTRSRKPEEVHQQKFPQDTVLEIITEFIRESGEALEITMSQENRATGIDRIILRSNK